MKTVIYKIIEYKQNKKQHDFWLYPIAKGQVIDVRDYKSWYECSDLFFLFHTDNKYYIGDIIEFTWSRNYWFWNNDSYIKYEFTKDAKLVECETYKTYTL